MNTYDVQITTNLNEVIILQICAHNDTEAELTAISIVENGEADVLGNYVTNCFVL